MILALILLAAGQSRRFGSADKLLATFAGEPLIVRTARRLALFAADRPLTIVTPPNATALTTALHHANLQPSPRFVINTNAANGIGTSIAAGVASLDADVTAALITPGDMPFLSTALIQTLIAAHLADGGHRPTHPILPTGTQMNPVIWPRSAFAELRALNGERGGKHILARTTCCTLSVHDVQTFADIDTPQDLTLLQQSVGNLEL
jgi:molybdenum cofactor cytidylyltransferase